MIELVTVHAYKCSICGWQWFNRKDGIAPKRCPRRSCRKLSGAPLPNLIDHSKMPSKDTVIARLVASDALRPKHDAKTCKLYRCGMCAASG